MNSRFLALIACLPLTMVVPTLASSATKPSTTPTTESTDAGEKDGDAKFAKVIRGSLPIRIDGEGVFEPVDATEIRLKPKAFNGELAIKSVVANGAIVKPGDVLLEIEDKPIKKEIATAENELETARANYLKAQSDSDLQQQADDLATKMAQDDVKNAADNLKWFDDVDGPQMLQQADLMVKQAKYSLDDQNDELDQLRKMYKTEDLTSATADIVIKRALRQVDLTKVQVTHAEDDARKVKTLQYPETRTRLQFTLDQQTNSLKQLTATHAQSAVQRKVALATAKQAISDAEQKLADLQKDLTLFTQTASAGGVAYFGQFNNRVWTGNEPKSFAIGEKLTSGSTMLTVIKPGKMQLALDVPESKFLAIKPGMDVTIVPTTTSAKLTGKTLQPTSIPKSSGLELDIELGGVDPAITPGMKASVAIDAGNADGLLLVPSGAVSDSKVWIKGPDDKPLAKRVITGRTGEDKTEIVDGLKEGDEIYEQPQK